MTALYTSGDWFMFQGMDMEAITRPAHQLAVGDLLLVHLTNINPEKVLAAQQALALVNDDNREQWALVTVTHAKCHIALVTPACQPVPLSFVMNVGPGIAGRMLNSAVNVV